MARVHGKDANLSINAVALEDELNTITMNMEVPEADITSFADAWQNFLAGKPNITTEIAGALNPTHDLGDGDQTLFEMFGAGPASSVFDPVGSGPAVGAPEYQCSANNLEGVLLASYQISLPVGGPGSYTATLQHSGLTTRALA